MCFALSYALFPYPHFIPLLLIPFPSVIHLLPHLFQCPSALLSVSPLFLIAVTDLNIVILVEEAHRRAPLHEIDSVRVCLPALMGHQLWINKAC